LFFIANNLNINTTGDINMKAATSFISAIFLSSLARGEQELTISDGQRGL